MSKNKDEGIHLFTREYYHHSSVATELMASNNMSAMEWRIYTYLALNTTPTSNTTRSIPLSELAEAHDISKNEIITRLAKLANAGLIINVNNEEVLNNTETGWVFSMPHVQ